MLNSTALLLDSNIRNSVCTPAKLPCRRVVEGWYNNNNNFGMRIKVRLNEICFERIFFLIWVCVRLKRIW
jgi:hypothetical protein